MANLVSMAGKGRRFSDLGYTLPKPLIPVQGQPMIYRVIDSLPKSDKWVFILNQEHIDNYGIDKIIKLKIPNAIITVDKDLLGGASIFCAEQYFHPDEEVFIASCDNAYLYNKEEFEKLKKDPSVDCILWTFTRDSRITESPKSWGYCVLGKDRKTITNMSVKIPPSDDPFNEHIVTATFYLKSAKTLYEAIRLMMKQEIKTNNEYYLDNLPIVLNMLGKKSIIFDVELYVGWGTPAELYKFDRIYHHYRFNTLKALQGLNQEQIKAWERFFTEQKWQK